jgi:chitinase
MRRFVAWTVLLAWLAGCATAEPLHGQEGVRVIAYVAGWSMPPHIAAEKLTHINFAFARIDREGRAVFEDAGLARALESLVALKSRNPRLKVIISIGGWEADGFSDAALTDASRRVFASSVVDLIRAHRADGADIDWEYPGQGVAGIEYRAEDKQNFTRLLKALRDALDAASTADGRVGGDRYVLTIASADREYFDHTEMDRVHEYLDWINVMSYDFFNSLTSTTGHHAGLYASEHAAPRDRNGDASIRQHLAAGIPREKLVLGAAFYGRGFEGVKADHQGLHQPYERYEGDHSYRELVEKFIGRRGFVRHWDEGAKAPFLWNRETSTFITYEDPESLRAKVQYVRDERLGGMMFWELGQDRDGELLDVIATLKNGDIHLF